MADRVLLLMPTTTYKAHDFMAAAERLGVEVVIGSDRRQALETSAPGHTLTLAFSRLERSVATIVEFARERPLRAVIGVDDETTVLAAAAGCALGLPHNPVEVARAAGDKFEMRGRLAAAGLRGPRFRRVGVHESPEALAREAGFPCVLKPLSLSASRGVIRADDPSAFVDAFRRIAAILRLPDVRRRGGDLRHLLVEDYLPGAEFSLEGVLRAGRLRPLALFDKPDPLTGPTFEETLFVTPSRVPGALQDRIRDEVAAGCRALGLQEGPVHAEIRVHQDQPWLLELAPRTIGGLCARTLRFGAGVSLEELVLAHALGLEAEHVREAAAAGVMMMPTPAAGILREVRGLDRARAVDGVQDVTLTRHRGARLVPLPEGNRYLGFIFARGETPERVEQALREAHSHLDFVIEAPRAGNGARATSRAGSKDSSRKRGR